jgi:hypothetical protein
MVLGNGGGEAAAAPAAAVAAPDPDADADADAAAAAAARSLSAFCALILCSKTALSDGPGIQCFDGDKKGKRRRKKKKTKCRLWVASWILRVAPCHPAARTSHGSPRFPAVGYDQPTQSI